MCFNRLSESNANAFFKCIRLQESLNKGTVISNSRTTNIFSITDTKPSLRLCFPDILRQFKSDNCLKKYQVSIGLQKFGKQLVV